MQRFERILTVLLSALILWLAIVLSGIVPQSNSIHLHAKPPDDGFVRIWNVVGRPAPRYTMMHESAVCERVNDEIYGETLDKTYYYVRIRCGEVWGFVSNFDVVELRPTR